MGKEIKEIKVIYVQKIKSWVLKESGPDDEGVCRGVVISVVDGMSKIQQQDYFLDKILEKNEKIEIYKAILSELYKEETL